MTRPLRILMYHRVGEPAQRSACDPSTISATASDFAWQMQLVARHFHAVGADEVVAAARGHHGLPPRALWLTFDDAYRDFAQTAWPILRRLRLPATVFVPTAYVGNANRAFWWDRLAQSVFACDRPAIVVPRLGNLSLANRAAKRTALRRLQDLVKRLPHDEAMHCIDAVCRDLDESAAPSGEVLGWSELRQLSEEGVTVAAHTRTHPALTRVPIERAREEIQGSRDDILSELGHCPPVFAYPFGDCSAEMAKLLGEEGFEVAVSCRAGFSRIGQDDPLLMRRINITQRTTRPVFVMRLTPAGERIDRWRLRAKRPAIAPAGTPRVAYIMSRFPKLSETFVLNEMCTLEALGVGVDVFPLLRARQPVTHPEVHDWVRRAHFRPLLSPKMLAAHAHFVHRRPAAYFGVLAEVLRKTWGSPKFFMGALAIFPKAVSFARDIERNGIDHVHAHFATHPTVAALIAHRLTGIPFSFTAHGSDLHVDRRMLDTKVEAAAFAIAISAFNKEVMVRECGERLRDRIHVVHCGVDTRFFRPEEWRRPGGPLQIICVASLEPVKGHRYLIEACARLAERGIDWYCHLVGDGPMRHALEVQIERAGLQSRVRWHGPQPRAAVAKLLAAADVAVLASHPTSDGRREGIPVALMEAMSSGLPVVATAISGIPELVEAGVTGLLVPSGDAEAMATALARLARDPELRRRMGQAGREKVVRSFDQEATAIELRRLFGGESGATMGEASRLAAVGVA
jgi:colanic acid/amylovoran biosynthesis glycosyltransferase